MNTAACLFMLGVVIQPGMSLPFDIFAHIQLNILWKGIKLVVLNLSLSMNFIREFLS